MAKIHSSQVGVAEVDEMAMTVIRAIADSFMLALWWRQRNGDGQDELNSTNENSLGLSWGRCDCTMKLGMSPFPRKSNNEIHIPSQRKALKTYFLLFLVKIEGNYLVSAFFIAHIYV